jgi:hypothetical protein
MRPSSAMVKLNCAAQAHGVILSDERSEESKDPYITHRTSALPKFTNRPPLR